MQATYGPDAGSALAAASTIGALRDIGKSVLGAGIGGLGEALLPKGEGFFSGLLGGVFSGVLDGIFGRGVGSGLDLPRLAGGGRLLAGQTAIVGERGPEFFTAAASGVVTPMAGRAAEGVAVQQTFNITTGVAQTVRAELIGLLPRIADTVKASLADEVQRGGAFATAFRG